MRNLVCAAVPEQVTMGTTGHKTRSVFHRYDIVSESDLRDATARLGTANIGFTKTLRIGRRAVVQRIGDR